MDPQRRFMLSQTGNTARISFTDNPEFTQSEYMNEAEVKKAFAESGYVGRYGFQNRSFTGEKPSLVLYEKPFPVTAFTRDNSRVPTNSDFRIFAYTPAHENEKETPWTYTSNKIRTVYSDPNRMVAKLKKDALYRLGTFLSFVKVSTTSDAIKVFLNQEPSKYISTHRNELKSVPPEYQAEVKKILEDMLVQLAPQDNQERAKLEKIQKEHVTYDRHSESSPTPHTMITHAGEKKLVHLDRQAKERNKNFVKNPFAKTAMMTAVDFQFPIDASTHRPKPGGKLVIDPFTMRKGIIDTTNHRPKSRIVEVGAIVGLTKPHFINTEAKDRTKPTPITIDEQ